MKKKIIMVIVVTFISLCIYKKRYSGEMEIYTSQSMTFSNSYIEDIVVIVNEKEIVDYEKCAKKIIEHCIQNDFQNIRFSYDVQGYPNELCATVYLKKDDIRHDKPVFKMSYRQSLEKKYKYNIKDAPEEFTLEIEKFN